MSVIGPFAAMMIGLKSLRFDLGRPMSSYLICADLAVGSSSSVESTVKLLFPKRLQ